MMGLEELYTKTMADETLKKAYVEAASENKLAEFLKTNGCEATEEELKAFMDSKMNKKGELDDDELDSVAGGGKCGTIYKNKRPVITVGNTCDLWRCEKCHTRKRDMGSSMTVDECITCRAWGVCSNCEYSRAESGLLLCYHPQRYDN